MLFQNLNKNAMDIWGALFLGRREFLNIYKYIGLID